TDTDSFPPTECTQVMRRRGIKGQNGGCKEINTFLLDTGVRVRNTCAGHHGIRSVGFNVVVCSHVHTSSYPNCRYTGQHLDNRIVDIMCENGVPVHLDYVQIG
uniref:Ribonuclease A-domain domain-containing protein n=1 Tax=Oreochromis niloticus TaxID=8128 RepID=A0A669CJM3_ORENI